MVMTRLLRFALAPLLVAAQPAFAAESGSRDGQSAAVLGEVGRVLDDPRTEQKLAGMIDAMTDAFLNLPVGEIEAAANGRTATAGEKRLTVRDFGRRDDPQFENKLRGRIGQSLPALRQGMKSLSAALPALVRSVEDASSAIERATANLPDPTYPKR